MPTFLRLRQGDGLQARARGTWAGGATSSAGSPSIWVVFITILFMLPQVSPITWHHLQLRVDRGARGPRLRRDLLAGLRAALVQGPEGPGHGRGTGRDRATELGEPDEGRPVTVLHADARSGRRRACSRLSSCASRWARERSTRSCSPSPTCRGGCRASGCPPSSSSTRWSSHHAEGCNYLLAVDVEMNTVDGYAMSSWERGYGDFVLAPGPGHHAPAAVARGDRAGARRPGVARTAARWSPRPGRSSRRRRDRLAERGWTALAGTELEFCVFKRLLRAGAGQRLPRPHPGEPVQRRLLDPRHRRGSSR